MDYLQKFKEEIANLDGNSNPFHYGVDGYIYFEIHTEEFIFQARLDGRTGHDDSYLHEVHEANQSLVDDPDGEEFQIEMTDNDRDELLECISNSKAYDWIYCTYSKSRNDFINGL